MLTKRTNILFNEEQFAFLVALASKNSTSVGDLVRRAVNKVYPQDSIDKRMITYNKIMKLKKGLGAISAKEIKEYINYGRRH